MSETPAAPAMEQVKVSLRSMWMAGDFGVIARSVAEDAANFVTQLQLAPGSRVLDIATGTGNLAIPLARLGHTVTGVDIAPNLLEQARERASAEGLSITFDEGDAEALPYPDASFDAIVSMFGVMFAPRPDRAAAEMARVLCPGGTLAMANWNPQSFSGKMFSVGARHVPPPPNVPPPVLWGDEATVRQRLLQDFTGIQTEIVPLSFHMPMSAAGAVDLFRRYFGPTKMAFSRLDEAGQRAFASDLEALWSGANLAQDPQTEVLVPNEYLQVTAVRR